MKTNSDFPSVLFPALFIVHDEGEVVSVDLARDSGDVDIMGGQVRAAAADAFSVAIVPLALALAAPALLAAAGECLPEISRVNRATKAVTFNPAARELLAAAVAAAGGPPGRVLPLPPGWTLNGGVLSHGASASYVGGSMGVVAGELERAGFLDFASVWRAAPTAREAALIALGEAAQVSNAARSVAPASVVAAVASDSSSDIARAHIALSEALEDEDAGNDEVRDAAVSLCDALNVLQARARECLAASPALASPVPSSDVLACLSDLKNYLEESHAGEHQSEHFGDGAEGCSYCAAIARAESILAAPAASELPAASESGEGGLFVELFILDERGQNIGRVTRCFPDLDAARIYAAARPGVRYLLEGWLPVDEAVGPLPAERVALEYLNSDSGAAGGAVVDCGAALVRTVADMSEAERRALLREAAHASNSEALLWVNRACVPDDAPRSECWCDSCGPAAAVQHAGAWRCCSCGSPAVPTPAL